MKCKINVHKLEPGMIPASDLLAGNGRLLVNSGIPLSGKHIRALKIWGVTEVEIRETGGYPQTEQSDTSGDGEVWQDPELLELAEKRIQPKFVHTDLEYPAMQEMFSLARVRLAREMARNPDLRDPPAHQPQTRTHGEILFGKHQSRPEQMDPGRLDFDSLEFPPLPLLTVQLQEALTDPQCTAARLAAIINRDPELSRRLLNLVNSSFYGFPFRIESVSQALNLLGTKQSFMMVLVFLFRSTFQGLKIQEMNLRKFWRHSIACAIAARTMGSFREGMNKERLFLAGMIHDIGKTILMLNFPQHMGQARKKAAREKKLSWQAESAVMGTDHALAGGMLVAKWKLPLILEHSVRYHHAPNRSLHFPDTAVVHVADILVHACSMHGDGPEYVPPLDARAWEILGLDPAVFALCLKKVDRFLQKSSMPSSEKS